MKQKNNIVKIKEKSKEYQKSLSQDAIASQIANSGKTRGLTPDIRNIYSRLFSEIPEPSYTEYTSGSGKEISAKEFISRLEKDGWEKIAETQTYLVEEKFFKPTIICYAKDPGYVISIMPSYRNRDSKKSDPEKRQEITFSIATFYNNVVGKDSVTDSITLYHPNEWDTENFDLDILKKVATLFEDCLIPESGEAEIGIISLEQGEYYVKTFSLEGKTPEFLFPDLHYGDGFTEFHDKLLKRIENNTKGLILFHGEPGTGKTQYIRILLKHLAQLKKSVLYAPPSVSASLLDPQMIEFISDWVLDSENDCILLIEDAEPLLENRKGGDGRTTGISNLLNMTDGLLNDILGLMVIATFNTELTNIDKALLRPQRLIARKEFLKINEEQGKALAKSLGIEEPNIKYPASLAEFYSVKQNHEVLSHGLQKEPTRIGFKSSY